MAPVRSYTEKWNDCKGNITCNIAKIIDDIRKDSGEW